MRQTSIYVSAQILHIATNLQQVRRKLITRVLVFFLFYDIFISSVYYCCISIKLLSSTLIIK